MSKAKKILTLTVIVLVAAIALLLFYLKGRPEDQEQLPAPEVLSPEQKKLEAFKRPDVIEYKVQLKDLPRFKVKEQKETDANE